MLLGAHDYAPVMRPRDLKPIKFLHFPHNFVNGLHILIRKLQSIKIDY